MEPTPLTRRAGGTVPVIIHVSGQEKKTLNSPVSDCFADLDIRIPLFVKLTGTKIVSA